LKYLNISAHTGTLSSYDYFTPMGWKNASLDLQDSTATYPRKFRVSATAGGVEQVSQKTTTYPF